jgi:hypothetical protein
MSSVVRRLRSAREIGSAVVNAVPPEWGGRVGVDAEVTDALTVE